MQPSSAGPGAVRDGELEPDRFSPDQYDSRSHFGTITVSVLMIGNSSWKTRGLRRMSSRPFDSQWQSCSSVMT